MKKLISILLFVLLTGCMDVSTDINIKNDDSGILIYKNAVMDDAEMDTEISELENWPGAKVTDLEYEKDDNTYIGSRIEISFSSLEEVNEILVIIFDPEETEKPLIFRENDRVILSAEFDAEEADDEYGIGDALYSYIIFDFTIQIEGEIIEHNAAEYNENNNSLTWGLRDLSSDGIELVYQTDTTKLADENLDNDEVADENNKNDQVDNEEMAEKDEKESQSSILTIIIGVGILIIGIVVFSRKT